MRSGKCTSLACVDHALAGSPGDIDFIVFDPLAVHPEGEGAEAALLGKIFRHPGAMRAERLGKILHQRGKKLWPVSVAVPSRIARRAASVSRSWSGLELSSGGEAMGENMGRDGRQIQEGE